MSRTRLPFRVRRLVPAVTTLALAVAGFLATAPAGSAAAATSLTVTPATSSGATLCAQSAAKAGFSFNRTVNTPIGYEPQMVVAIAVAMAESSCGPSASYTNTDGSVDRGLWQINSSAHAEVSDACAYQPQCNADAAWNISNHGTDWSPWTTYDTGAWESHLSEADAALSNGFTIQLRNQGTNTCLDADSASRTNGAPIWQWTCNPSDAYQQWTVVDTVGALPILRNNGTGTCLDWDGAKAGNAAPIFQWACGSGYTSEWFWFNGSGHLNTNGAAQATLQNGRNNTCLDADAAAIGDAKPIWQWGCNGGDFYQQWN